MRDNACFAEENTEKNTITDPQKQLQKYSYLINNISDQINWVKVRKHAIIKSKNCPNISNAKTLQEN